MLLTMHSKFKYLVSLPPGATMIQIGGWFWPILIAEGQKRFGLGLGWGTFLKENENNPLVNWPPGSDACQIGDFVS